jgi:fatty acid desaturase
MSFKKRFSDKKYDQIHNDFEAIKERHRADLGDKDVKHIKSIRMISRIFEAIGRFLVMILPGPFALIGVPFIFLHRNIEAIEIGHNVLHGQYDSFPSIPQFHSRKFKWKSPIDEDSWRQEHNAMHHVHTNVFEMDPDLNHGFLRTNTKTPYNIWHRFQVPIYLLVVYPIILYRFNGQNLGDNEHFRETNFPEGNKGYAIIPNSADLTKAEKKKRHFRAVFRVVFKEYMLFPVISLFLGYGFFKVFLANLLADVMNNYWIAFTIQATHLTEPLQPENAIDHKGKWYVSQLDSSINFKGSRMQSILWGHLNYQVEHHLFPDIPAHRYPEIADEVEAVCKKYDLPYKTNESWWIAIKNYVNVLWHFSFKDAEATFENKSILTLGNKYHAK